MNGLLDQRQQEKFPLDSRGGFDMFLALLGTTQPPLLLIIYDIL
jgi:hypothetical protein